jgi:hypothetical protein
MIIIKDSIKEALRKLLPVKHILQVYLGEDINYNQVDETFDKAISEVEENYLPKLINKDLSITNQILSEKSQGSIILDIINNTPNSVISQKNTKQSDTSELKNNMSSDNYKKINSNNMSSDNYKKINSKNIVNDSKAMPLNKPYEITTITSDLSNQNIDNPIVAKLNNSDVNINNKITNNNNIDDKIKKILKNDLAIDSDNIDTSLTYDNYQEIFSNSYENK